MMKLLTSLLTALCCLSIVACGAMTLEVTPEQQRQEQLNMLLQLAAGDGNLTAMQEAIANGANLHAGNDWALRRAAFWEQWVAVAFLLQRGADRSKLHPARQQDFRDSDLAQDYILNELQTALDYKDWYTVEQVLTIIPVHELPAHVQQQIEQLVVPVASKVLLALKEQGLAQSLQGRILHSIIGPTAFGIFCSFGTKGCTRNC